MGTSLAIDLIEASTMKSIAILILICFAIYLFIQPSTGCWFVVTSGNNTYVVFGRDAEERQQDVDWDKYNLSKQAFTTCNVDGEEGLTWDEISSCEDQFCGLLTIDCPTQDDFEAFDLNGDGILTWTEFMEANLAVIGQERDLLDL